jgi:aspartate/methionine/tyrosine aminotransferase
MTPLADLTGSLNLGQGFPDWSPPSFLLDAVDAPPPGTPAAEPLLHQYSRSKGDPLLVRTIAEQYSPRLFPSAPHAIDPLANVLVTVGASHALSLGIGALCGPGDEAVLIEPAFDCYTGAVLVAGATPVYVPLRPRPGVATRTSADFKLDVHELAAAMTPRTRLLVLNSPHNPTGKVFSRGELQAIARVLDDWPHVAVLSDEVYEHMTFNPELPHVSFASLSEDAFARTISMYVSRVGGRLSGRKGG